MSNKEAKRWTGCPFCAERMQWRAGKYTCSGTKFEFPASLSETIRSACVHTRQDIRRRDGTSGALLCPNCAGPLETFQENMRSLDCRNCSFKLRSIAYDELMALKALHKRGEG
jgi:hypothetical protein